MCCVDVYVCALVNVFKFAFVMCMSFGICQHMYDKVLDVLLKTGPCMNPLICIHYVLVTQLKWNRVWLHRNLYRHLSALE